MPSIQDWFKGAALEVQEYVRLLGATFRGAVTRPIYRHDIVEQFDLIGVGSMTVVLLTAALLAGCVASDPDKAVGCPGSGLDPPGIRLLGVQDDPIDDDKDNATVFETTNVRTCSLPAIGWSALSPDGIPHKYLGELDS